MLKQELVDVQAAELVAETLAHFKLLRTQARLPDKWREYEELYFNGSEDYYGGKARVRIPILHTHTERIVPKMDKTIFPPDGDFFGAVPGDHSNNVLLEDAEKVVKTIKRQFGKCKLRTKLIGSYRNLCIYGTTFIKYYWGYSIKRRFKRKKNAGGLWERIEEEDIVSDGPTAEVLDIWDVYADPKDENLEGAVIQEIVTDYQKIKDKAQRKTESGDEVGVYRNTELLKDSRLSQINDPERALSDLTRGVGDRKYGKHEKKIRTYEYWGPIPQSFLTLNEDDSDEEVEGYIVVGVNSPSDSASSAVTGSDLVVLRVSPNPFDHQEKPFLRGRYIKVEGQLYGMSMYEVNISLAKELNTVRSQFMDMRTFMLKNKWLRDRNSEISDHSLKDLSEQVIDTNDVNGLQALRPPDFSGSALASEANIKADLEDGTGATSFLGGTPMKSSLERTAEGVATMMSAGLERFELVVTQYEEEILKPLAEGFWWLNQQFLDDEIEIAMTGGRTLKFSPRDVDFIYDLQFLGIHELGQKSFKINALNILIQNVAPFAEFGLDPLPILLRMVKLLGMGDLIPEIDKRPEAQAEFTPEGEKQLLMSGQKVRVDLNDDHAAFIEAYKEILNTPNLPEHVKANTEEALGQRMLIQQVLAGLSNGQ